MSVETEIFGEGPPLLVKAGELAQMLNISVRVVYQMVRGGGIAKPIKFGRSCYRWNREAVEQWVAGGCVPPDGKTGK